MAIKAIRRLVLAALTAGAVDPPEAGAEPPKRRLPSTSSVDGHPVQTLLEPDAIPAIDRPEHAAASRAWFMDGDEPVIGVVVGGEARAYALEQLDAHEIVNDVLGTRAIAVTW